MQAVTKPSKYGQEDLLDRLLGAAGAILASAAQDLEKLARQPEGEPANGFAVLSALTNVKAAQALLTNTCVSPPTLPYGSQIGTGTGPGVGTRMEPPNGFGSFNRPPSGMPVDEAQTDRSTYRVRYGLGSLYGDDSAALVADAVAMREPGEEGYVEDVLREAEEEFEEVAEEDLE